MAATVLLFAPQAAFWAEPSVGTVKRFHAQPKPPRGVNAENTMESEDDPFAECLPPPSRGTNAVTKISLPPNSSTPSSSSDDIGIAVERVVSRIVKETLTPLIERVRLSAEKRLDRLQATLDTVQGRQQALGEEIDALKGLLEARMEQSEQSEQLEQQPQQPQQPQVETKDSSSRGEDGPSTASLSTIEEVEAMRAGLQALMRENEARMKLLDERLQATPMPPPPPPPPPPPSRPYAPPPPPFQHMSPLAAAVRTQTAPPLAPPPPPQAGVPVERVIDEIAAMGFSREEVWNVLRELTTQGKPLDMNIVLDRLG